MQYNTETRHHQNKAIQDNTRRDKTITSTITRQDKTTQYNHNKTTTPQ